MAALLPQLDGGFQTEWNANIPSIPPAPLSPDLAEINLADIMNLLGSDMDSPRNCSPLGRTHSTSSEESLDSDSSDVASPSWDHPGFRFPMPQPPHDLRTDPEDSQRERKSSFSESPKSPEANVELRSGLSVRDITAEYDSNLIASHGKRRGRKPSIKSWRRKNEYSDLLKKVIENYQCENTTLKYEAMQLEKMKKELLKILQSCQCRSSAYQSPCDTQ